MARFVESFSGRQFSKSDSSDTGASVNEEAGVGVKEIEETKPEITAEEYAERVERLRSLGRVIGSDFAMRVEVGKERGWRYKFKPVNTIEADPVDIAEKSVEYCLGIIAHEGAHRAISRTDFIPKKVWQESGFSFLMNAVEDPRVNNWVGEKYEGAKDWLKMSYDEDMAPEDMVDKRAKEKLGYTPKHIRFGLEIIRRWHTGEFSADVPEDIREVLDTTFNYAKAAYNSLPASKAEENEITDKAKMVYRIVYSKIWPEYKKLVDKSIDEETLRQILKDMMEGGQMEGGEPGEKGSGDELSEEIKKKIKEILDSMTEEEKRKLLEGAKAKAKAILDELDTELGKELRGHMADQPETSTEESKRMEAEDAERRARAKIEAEAGALREQLEQAREKNKNAYDRAFEEVKPYIDKVAEDIMNIFIAKRHPQFKKSFPGQKLRLKGAMAYESSDNYRDLFERRLNAERKSLSFFLLVDLSGSMSGEKIAETFKGAVLFAEALNRVSETMGSVKVAIYGFQDTLIKYKEFGEKMDDDLRQAMSVMPRETENRGVHNGASYNSDGYCVEKSAEILNQQQTTGKFLFVLSDGQPAPDGAHRAVKVQYNEYDPSAELRAVVAQISKEGNIHVLGVGLGPHTEHVSDYYRSDLAHVDNIPSVDVDKLSRVLGDKLEQLVIK
ncbi:MAG: hypothetical protein NTW66_02655 [Candidatus Magasanikbacteria bacterium]|nr:hypothetical protein [Candidatus Magasanikbacteria bacterium]